MAQQSSYDVFLSHSSKDRATVRAVAERLRADGLRVWLDDWEIRPGDSIPAKIEEGLECSRVLVLCMSAHAFGSDWAQLESGTFRFRDPLNKERRFIPLRLDDAPIKGSLAQFLSIKWLPPEREEEYPKLLEACRPMKTEVASVPQAADAQVTGRILSLGHTDRINSVAFSPHGSRALSGSEDKTVRLWDVETGACLQVLEGHSGSVWCVAWSPDGRRALSVSDDKTVRLWDVESGACLGIDGHSGGIRSIAWSPDGRSVLSISGDNTIRLWGLETGSRQLVLEGHSGGVRCVVWSPDGRRVLSAAEDQTVRLWDAGSGACLRVLEGHAGVVWCVAWSPDGRRALSAGDDQTVRLWDVGTGTCLQVFKGHSNSVRSVAWSLDGMHALSGAVDNTVRQWNVETGDCLRVIESHSSAVWSLAWSHDARRALSGDSDNSLRLWDVETGACLRVFEGHSAGVRGVAWSPDGRRALSAAYDQTLRLWDMQTGACLRVLNGHSDRVWSVAWSRDGRRALSGSYDHTVRVWDVETGVCLRVLEGHAGRVWGVAWSPDGRRAMSGAYDQTVRLWDVETGVCLHVLEGHSERVWGVAWSPDGQGALSGAEDDTIRLWDVETGACLRVLKGHSAGVWSVEWSPDSRRALCGSWDKTVRLWDVETGACLRVLEGHSGGVRTVAWSPDGRRALSGGADNTVRLWDVETGVCLRVLEGHSNGVRSVAWSPDGRHAFSAAENGVMRVWNLVDAAIGEPRTAAAPQVRYTNAKVLLVGDSGVGKSGLSNYLTQGIRVADDKPIPSTDGAWATHWPLPHTRKSDGVDREIWLWDFAGQVDYRLVHQLFMDDAAAAVLVFNPQHENPFESLGHWNRDLQRATRKPFAKLLAAGRIDRGGLVVSAAGMQKFMAENGFPGPLLQTSAKTGEGCDQLRDAIVRAIDWKSIPETTSPALYHRMKQEILQLRDIGLVLIRLAELKQRMEMMLRGEEFQLKELEAVVSLLAGPGMIQRLDFGGFILLRPEVLSRYAAAVVRKVRRHPQEMGCIREDELLAGDLDYQDFPRLPRDDEAVVLRTLLETFVSRAWCLRQPCEGTAMLTFPSYFRRERKEQPGHPYVLVTYRFDGPADEIYATLVVRLHHTVAFEGTDLWKSAADFRTQTGAALGFTMMRESEGASRMEVYFATGVDENSRVLFLRYVHDHLVQHAQNVKRLRHYACGNKRCDAAGQLFADQARIDKALAPGGAGKVFCPACGKAISLRDTIEEKFDSPAVREQAREEQSAAEAGIDKQSQELQALHHTGSIVDEAGQIYRSVTNSDHGIDGEIEFKDQQGRATGKRLYLQLKTGDSYSRKRPRDDAEVFDIKNPRWADYWQHQAYPVMLVIRTSDGEIRWMDVSAYLKRESGTGGKAVRQIVFTGERLDVMSVLRWRDRSLNAPPAPGF